MKIPEQLVVTRVFDATPEQIWAAFTDPDKLHKFFGPKGTTIPREEVTMDVRVGGEFSLTMHNDENGELYPMQAEYVMLDEPNKIQFKTTGGIDRHDRDRGPRNAGQDAADLDHQGTSSTSRSTPAP